MNALAALQRLRGLGVDGIRTRDAAAALDVSVGAASKLLVRLTETGHVRKIVQGVFWLPPRPMDRLQLPEILTAPAPSYVSLQSALHIHGLIEQIPSILYAVSLSRAEDIVTTVGVVSIHVVAPELFGGYEVTDHDVKLATPAKALFDIAYLSGTRDRRFARLPELEIDARIRRNELRRWTARIASPRRRAMVQARLASFMAR